MIDLTNEQKVFLQELSKWAHSDECQKTIFNKVCSALQELIEKKEKSREQQKTDILKEMLVEEKEKYSRGEKYSKTNLIIESIHRWIGRCYENELFANILLKFTHDIEIVKERILSSEINVAVPSDFSLDMEIENRQKLQKLTHLITVLDEWISNPSNFLTISNNKILAIQAKYKKYRDDFYDNKSYCSLCTLANYIDKPEEAKEFLLEIFTHRQESFYTNIESWAKFLEDKECSKWISSFLYKGRNLRIRNIKILKYIDDEKKAKEFLLSKYNEKLNWDKKKKTQRENKYKSIFENYDQYKNSLNSFIPGLTKNTKLYSKCLSSNVKGKSDPFSLISHNDGFEIWEDCIRVGSFVYHLSLQATNRLFYTYSSTYRKHTTSFTFFSPFVLDIIKEYSALFLDNKLDYAKGCIVVRDFETRNIVKGYCCILTEEASQFGNEPLFVYNSLASSGKCYHDVAGYRLVFKALIWHLLKDKTSKIDFSASRDFSIDERSLLSKLISQSYDKMSFDDKYICHFIDCDKYKFPITDPDFNNYFKRSFTDKIINLKNCINSQYNTKILEDGHFQFAKVEYEYGDSNFKKLVDSIGGNISRGRYVEVWSDWTSDDFISILRVLAFINWVYVSNETGNVKKITACWLLSIIYEQYEKAYDRDKNFWTLMLSYVLIENQLIYDTLLCQLKKNEQKNDENINITCIIVTLTKDIKFLKQKLTFEQKCFLSKNIHKCTLFEDFHKQNSDTEYCKRNEVEIILEKLCKLIKEHQGTVQNFSKPIILDLLKDVPKFIIPQNFTYTHMHYRNYDKYNGDYKGSYAHDVMEYSNSDIDTIFDGEPDAYWNID